MHNPDIQNLNIFENGYDIQKVNEDTSRIIIKFTLEDEDMERTIDFTFLNY